MLLMMTDDNDDYDDNDDNNDNDVYDEDEYDIMLIMRMIMRMIMTMIMIGMMMMIVAAHQLSRIRATPSWRGQFL